VKCLVYYHPDDEQSLRQNQEDKLLALYQACRTTNHELLLEIIPPADMVVTDDTLARALDNLYAIGIFPDWWKLPPQDTDVAWNNVAAVIEAQDPLCRGVVILGLGASENELQRGFEQASGQTICKGFAVGRSVFQASAEQWFADEIDDNEVIEQVGTNYSRLVQLWAQRQS
jgi:5-dehydro-2-deoxygluconokinase